MQSGLTHTSPISTLNALREMSNTFKLAFEDISRFILTMSSVQLKCHRLPLTRHEIEHPIIRTSVHKLNNAVLWDGSRLSYKTPDSKRQLRIDVTSTYREQMIENFATATQHDQCEQTRSILKGTSFFQNRNVMLEQGIQQAGWAGHSNIKINNSA